MRGKEHICRNCRFWKRITGWKIDPGWTGECSSEKMIYTGDEEYSVHDALYYGDYEAYAASVSTGEDFGCIHWKSNQNKPAGGP